MPADHLILKQDQKPAAGRLSTWPDCEFREDTVVICSAQPMVQSPAHKTFSSIHLTPITNKIPKVLLKYFPVERDTLNASLPTLKRIC